VGQSARVVEQLILQRPAFETPQPMQTVSSTSGMNILFPPAFFGSGTSDIAATWQALAHL